MEMHYQGLSDEELLLSCCKQDDLIAYGVLFDRYAPKLYKLGMRYLQNQPEVEDIAISLLFNIWERRHSLVLESKLSSYLFRAMHYKTISYLRRAKPLIVDIDAVPEDLLIGHATADQNLLTKEAEDVYLEKLTKLSPQRRKVFELSREHQLTYAEIASELNISINTVENHMVAALSILRKHYEEHQGVALIIILSILLKR